jgi:YfiH family protein
MKPEFFTAPSVSARHGYFSRRGGVSVGPYASLNCSVSSADRAEAVLHNRGLVAEAMGVDPAMLLGVSQVHGCGVAVVETPWALGCGPKADAMVTRRAGVALGIVTADCAPVLLADAAAGVVGAAHAGWRGACGGVLEAVVAAMIELGARTETLAAAVGPCIAQQSYEVAEDLRRPVLDSLEGAERFFAVGQLAGRWQFDLPGYCVARLAACGVQAISLAMDTCQDEARFFSHRRRTLAAGGPIGHQISVIVA